MDAMSVLEVNNGSMAGPKPLVVVCHGWTGQKENMLDMAARFANIGCFAVSIDACYHGQRKRREGDPPLLEAMIETGRELDELIDRYSDHPQVDGNRVGLLGVSMGGAIVLKYLTQTRRSVRAAVSAITTSVWSDILHNAELGERLRSMEADISKLEALARDEQPINRWSAIPNMPLLLLAGDEDPLVPLPHAERLSDLLRRRDGEDSLMKLSVYRGVKHDFTTEMAQESIEWMRRFV
ncbi:alpha/beta hydrolase family protein [Paenibacillus cymbidii]|uniref:alpha/beta hydrolase family protein n=1 Tax=Paenibacillus cymbidii TaxID=1639034 RepID=UPI001081F736|nr:alpha/beta fold hydrolase [Paenibacillus cymbidii]